MSGSLKVRAPSAVLDRQRVRQTMAIDMTLDSGCQYRVVIRTPGAPWPTYVETTLDGAMESGRRHALAILAGTPRGTRVRRLEVVVVALCPRCNGRGSYGVRTGLAVAGGQTECSACRGTAVRATVAREYVTV